MVDIQLALKVVDPNQQLLGESYQLNFRPSFADLSPILHQIKQGAVTILTHQHEVIPWGLVCRKGVHLLPAKDKLLAGLRLKELLVFPNQREHFRF